MGGNGNSNANGGRRERRKQEVHGRILRAAVELFERKGIAATTVEEIAEAADFAEKTFYNHFPTKKHLIDELAAGLVDHTFRILEEARKQPMSTRERILYFAERSAELSEEKQALRRELTLEVIRVSQLNGATPERPSPLRESWAALLRDGLEAGDVGDRFSAEFLAEIAVGSFGAIGASWASRPDYPLRERLAEFARFLGDAASASRDLD